MQANDVTLMVEADPIKIIQGLIDAGEVSVAAETAFAYLNQGGVDKTKMYAALGMIYSFNLSGGAELGITIVRQAEEVEKVGLSEKDQEDLSTMYELANVYLSLAMISADNEPEGDGEETDKERERVRKLNDGYTRWNSIIDMRRLHIQRSQHMKEFTEEDLATACNTGYYTEAALKKVIDVDYLTQVDLDRVRMLIANLTKEVERERKQEAIYDGLNAKINALAIKGEEGKYNVEALRFLESKVALLIQGREYGAAITNYGLVLSNYKYHYGTANIGYLMRIAYMIRLLNNDAWLSQQVNDSKVKEVKAKNTKAISGLCNEGLELLSMIFDSAEAHYKMQCQQFFLIMQTHCTKSTVGNYSIYLGRMPSAQIASTHIIPSQAAPHIVEHTSSMDSRVSHNRQEKDHQKRREAREVREQTTKYRIVKPGEKIDLSEFVLPEAMKAKTKERGTSGAGVKKAPQLPRELERERLKQAARYKRWGEYDKAIELYESILREREKRNDYIGMFKSHAKLFSIYLEKREYDKAYAKLKEMGGLVNEPTYKLKLEQKVVYVVCKINLYDNDPELPADDKEESIENVLNEAVKGGYNEPHMLAKLNAAIGKIYEAAESKASALYYYERATSCLRGKINQRSDTYKKISKLYITVGNLYKEILPEANDQKYILDLVAEYYESYIDSQKKCGVFGRSSSEIYEFHLELGDLYSHYKFYRPALEYYNKAYNYVMHNCRLEEIKEVREKLDRARTSLRESSSEKLVKSKSLQIVESERSPEKERKRSLEIFLSTYSAAKSGVGKVFDAALQVSGVYYSMYAYDSANTEALDNAVKYFAEAKRDFKENKRHFRSADYRKCALNIKREQYKIANMKFITLKTDEGFIDTALKNAEAFYTYHKEVGFTAATLQESVNNYIKIQKTFKSIKNYNSDERYIEANFRIAKIKCTNSIFDQQALDCLLEVVAVYDANLINRRWFMAHFLISEVLSGCSEDLNGNMVFEAVSKLNMHDFKKVITDPYIVAKMYYNMLEIGDYSSQVTCEEIEKLSHSSAIEYFREKYKELKSHKKGNELLALIYMQRAETLEADNNKLSEREEGWYCSLQGRYRDASYREVLLREAFKVIKLCKYSSILLDVTELLVDYLAEKKEYSMALEVLQEASVYNISDQKDELAFIDEIFLMYRRLNDKIEGTDAKERLYQQLISVTQSAMNLNASKGNMEVRDAYMMRCMRFYIALQKYEECLKFFKAVDYKEQNAIIECLRGKCYIGLNKKQEAYACFHDALKLLDGKVGGNDQDVVEVHTAYAVCLMRYKDHEKAFNHFSIVIESLLKELNSENVQQSPKEKEAIVKKLRNRFSYAIDCAHVIEEHTKVIEYYDALIKYCGSPSIKARRKNAEAMHALYYYFTAIAEYKVVIEEMLSSAVSKRNAELFDEELFTVYCKLGDAYSCVECVEKANDAYAEAKKIFDTKIKVLNTGIKKIENTSLSKEEDRHIHTLLSRFYLSVGEMHSRIAMSAPFITANIPFRRIVRKQKEIPAKAFNHRQEITMRALSEESAKEELYFEGMFTDCAPREKGDTAYLPVLASVSYLRCVIELESSIGIIGISNVIDKMPLNKRNRTQAHRSLPSSGKVTRLISSLESAMAALYLIKVQVWNKDLQVEDVQWACRAINQESEDVSRINSVIMPFGHLLGKALWCLKEEDSLRLVVDSIKQVEKQVLSFYEKNKATLEKFKTYRECDFLVNAIDLLENLSDLKEKKFTSKNGKLFIYKISPRGEELKLVLKALLSKAEFVDRYPLQYANYYSKAFIEEPRNIEYFIKAKRGIERFINMKFDSYNTEIVRLCDNLLEAFLQADKRDEKEINRYFEADRRKVALELCEFMRKYFHRHNINNLKRMSIEFHSLALKHRDRVSFSDNLQEYIQGVDELGKVFSYKAASVNHNRYNRMEISFGYVSYYFLLLRKFLTKHADIICYTNMEGFIEYMEDLVYGYLDADKPEEAFEAIQSLCVIIEPEVIIHKNVLERYIGCLNGDKNTQLQSVNAQLIYLKAETERSKNTRVLHRTRPLLLWLLDKQYTLIKDISLSSPTPLKDKMLECIFYALSESDSYGEYHRMSKWLERFESLKIPIKNPEAIVKLCIKYMFHVNENNKELLRYALKKYEVLVRESPEGGITIDGAHVHFCAAGLYTRLAKCNEKEIAAKAEAAAVVCYRAVITCYEGASVSDSKASAKYMYEEAILYIAQRIHLPLMLSIDIKYLSMRGIGTFSSQDIAFQRKIGFLATKLNSIVVNNGNLEDYPEVIMMLAHCMSASPMVVKVIEDTPGEGNIFSRCLELIKPRFVKACIKSPYDFAFLEDVGVALIGLSYGTKEVAAHTSLVAINLSNAYWNAAKVELNEELKGEYTRKSIEKLADAVKYYIDNKDKDRSDRFRGLYTKRCEEVGRTPDKEVLEYTGKKERALKERQPDLGQLLGETSGVTKLNYNSQDGSCKSM